MKIASFEYSYIYFRTQRITNESVCLLEKLTEAGGDVNGLSSTINWISVFMSLSSTGKLAILFARMSSLASAKYVTSTGIHNNKLLRRIRLRKYCKSLRCGGRCVSWLQEASSSVKQGIRPSSSGRLDSRLFETIKTCKGSWHISRGNATNWLRLKSKWFKHWSPLIVSGIERIMLW